MSTDQLSTSEARSEESGNRASGVLSRDLVGILDTIDVPIAVVREDSTLTGYNRAAAEVLGLVHADLGRTVGSIAALSEAKGLTTLCADVITDRLPLRQDVRIGQRWFALRVAPYVPAQGQSGGVLLTFTNVTALRASLEQAVYEREHAKAILNTITHPLMVLDADLRIRSANRAFYDVFGLSREDARLARLGDLFGDISGPPGIWTSLRQAMSTNSDLEPTEIERDAPTGVQTLLVEARRIPVDARLAILLSAQDISERKQAEKTRASLAAIVESSDDAIIGTDLDGTITTWNRGAERLFGHTAPEAVGRSIQILIPSDRFAEERTILDRIRTGERVDHFETIRRHQNGTLLDVSLTVSPIADAGGVVVGASKTARDITERKRAQIALQQADRRKDEFLALLAHELRNPLAPILTGLELMRISGDSPQSVARVRSIMDRQVRLMVRLIDDLLDVSRIASGKIELQRSPCLLSELVRNAIEGHRHAFASRRIDVSVELPELPCVLDVDPARFGQVLSNLLHNAVKFTPPDGQIRMSAAVDETAGVPHLTLAVTDSGIGISEDMLPRVFELFTQVESATQRAHGGLGIGLALARRLIELHGGDIVAHSDGLGRGSSFVITMPLAVCAAARQPPSAGLPQVACRVLIIDDNQDAASTLAMLIEHLGASVKTAHDATSGIEAVQAFCPDVVLLDVGMPAIDGYETCRRIRRLSSSRQLVIIALTGWGQAQDKERAVAAGFDTHLTKPVDLAMLARVLENTTR